MRYRIGFGSAQTYNEVIMAIFDFLFKREHNKQIKKLSVIADEVVAKEERYAAMSDEELKAQTPILEERFQKGETLDDLLPDAFAVCREAAWRVLKMKHFYVQIIGGIVLHQGRIAEMKTGEGKTLVATLPAYLNALSKKSVHIVTVNDYLAKRDAEWMGKVFKFLGMTVGVITQGMSLQEKKAAYAASVTYGTNNEFGFDYLRDNMATNLDNIMQRDHAFAIVDEVDSILIDEARTPLIISGASGEKSEIYKDVSKFVRTLDEEDYVSDLKDKYIYLSESGVEKAESFFRIDNLGDVENADLNNKICTALRAHKLMSVDKDYIVEDGEIVIVDEFTGRKMVGRRYSEGLHQSIEAKEGVRIREENMTIATITFQNLFRLYGKLSGMTGTAMTEEAEFKGIYNLDVVEIPTNLPMVRKDEADKIYATEEQKFKAVVDEIVKTHETGQPILVGTISVEVSERLSKILQRLKVKHNVLNAKNHLEEASIIAQAGQEGAVTIATNMAGRGTDILLGGNPEYKAKEKLTNELNVKYKELAVEEREPKVAHLLEVATAFNNLSDEEEIAARNRFNELVKEFKVETDKEKQEVIARGGLRVVGTERHESRRIDNQLRGRAGRQGDPGSSCFYLSFEDELLKRFGGDRLKNIMETLVGTEDDAVLQMPMLSRQIETAQKRCEDANYERRKYVLNYDDVMNKQRQLIYSQRNEVLNGADVHEQILKYFQPLVDGIVYNFVDFSQGDETTIDYDSLNLALEQRVLLPDTNIVTKDLCRHLKIELVLDTVLEEVVRQYEEKVKLAEDNGIDFRATERNVLLNQVDRHWMQHIDQMDALRKGIGLRGYGQRDPVVEYRREGFVLFDEMVEAIQRDATTLLAKIDMDAVIERKNAYDRQREMIRNFTPASAKKTVGRNDPCPCGSGKKYKNCCGK